MSPAPYKLGRSPPTRDDCDPAFPAAGHPAAGPSHVQVVRPRRCAAAGAPPGPAAEPVGTQPAIAGTQHHPLASGPRLHREWAALRHVRVGRLSRGQTLGLCRNQHNKLKTMQHSWSLTRFPGHLG
jgi:hypothetical protein